MKILVINGPNLNLLGKRNAKLYGNLSLSDINILLQNKAAEMNIEITFFQSNHEGELITHIQKNSAKASGILLNPGALTHYGYSLRDALEDAKLPVVEVHLSDINKREPFRKIAVLDGIVIKKISGLKDKGYLLGFAFLIKYLNSL